MDTFIINTTIENTSPTLEVFNTTFNVPYIEHGALLGIMNELGSYSNIRITSIEINEIGSRTTTTQVRFNIKKITAITGGESLTPVKFDSSTSIASQVSCVKNPSSVTLSGTELRSLNIYSGSNMITALRTLSTTQNLSTQVFAAKDTNVSGIILNENEGFTITSENILMSPFALEVQVTFNIGSNTFMLNEEIVPTAERPILAIFNGSGSGQIIKIVRVEIKELKTDDLFRFVTIEAISGLAYGDSLTPISLDSTSTALASEILIKKNCGVLQANTDATRLSRQAQKGGDLPIRQVSLPYHANGLSLANGLLALHKGRHKVFQCNPLDSNSQILLREGQGFALFQRRLASNRGNYEIIINFTREITGSAGGGGGETSHVF